MAKETKHMAAPKGPDLAWSVMGTLAWFSIHKRPLSVPEIRRRLLRNNATEDEIRDTLAVLDTKITEHRGFYSITDTKVRYPDTETDRWYRYKWWRVRLAVSILRLVPYVRLVAIANTVADRTASRDSDIDVFIVVKHGRLYLARTMIAALLLATGLKRHGKKVANRVCITFFVSTEGLDLQSIAFEPYDIYLAYWIHQLVPVLDDGHTHQDVLAANSWINTYLPSAPESSIPTRPPSLTAKLQERLFGTFVGELLEQRLGKWQKARILRKSKAPELEDGASTEEREHVQIVATDQMLKLHEKERRLLYRQEWEELMKKQGYDPAIITV